MVGDMTTRSVGVPGDAAAFAWFIGWWPHALENGLNPLRMSVVWAPDGITAAWATGVPSLALAAWPLTALAGPIVSVNVLMLLAPALAAFTMYMLARDLVGGRLFALPAGLLFGFSAFVHSHMLGHLNLAFVALIPLAPWAALRVARGVWSRRRGVVVLGAVVGVQLGVSSELALLGTVFGVIACAVAWLLERSTRDAIRRIVAIAVPGWLLGALVASPLLVAQLRAGPIGWHPARRQDSQDLLGLVVPDSTFLLSPLDGVSDGFTSSLAERGAYISVFGVLVLMALFVVRDGRPARCLVPVLGLAAFVLSLGPVLHVAGIEFSVPLPSAAFIVTPVMEYAVSGRFGLFLALAVALGSALLLAARPRQWWATALVAGACLVLVPDLASPRWAPAETPAALRSTEVVPAGARVVLLPVTEGMRWQAVTGYRYTQVGGYTGVILPPAYRPWRDVVDGLYGIAPPPNAERLDAYLRAFGAERVVIGPGGAAVVADALASRGWRVVQRDGVLVVDPPPG
ncbi:MAG: hypothetical protein ACKOD0_07450 [Actinomycetota bacterium]